MIPFDFFQCVIYKNFMSAIEAKLFYINLPSESSKFIFLPSTGSEKNCFVMYDQEPIDMSLFTNDFDMDPRVSFFMSTKRILITSEYGIDQEALATSLNAHHVHYFYHALLCHEWYRKYWFENTKINNDFDRTYIIYNNLTLNKRLYRANLVVDLYNNNLLQHGYVSYNSNDIDQIPDSIKSYRLIPTPHKINILTNLDKLSKQLIIDSDTPSGILSAEIDISGMQRAFVNVVTETVFYENKVHLTEKIFKPIIAKMPFLLLAGAGNLDYLRRYGFKTFSDFWDESYDSITNPADRHNAVMSILKELCNKSHSELVTMRKGMAEILDHNYNHFYTNMRSMVVNELTDNLAVAMDTVNMEYPPELLQHLNRILSY